ncbi:MAG: protein kinase [Polyangiales bacterium]
MMVGTIVAARFRVIEAVGQGGMGQVFRAEDLSTGRPVALKTLSAIDRAMLERFVLEAKTLASLDHPSIVGYVAHGTTEQGAPFLAMRWLDGEDLSRVLRRGPLSIADTLAVMRRVCEGLAVAHQRGIVHRDLKPANIVLVGGAASAATIVDFGIARQDVLTRGLTRTGAIIGTVGYMSPEQLQGAKDIDGRSDLFSLACVAFECITGRPAFAADNLGAAIAQILLGESPRLRDVAPRVAPALDELVASLMRTRREDRMASARAAIEAIDAISIEERDASRAATELAARDERPTLRGERTPVAIVLAWPSATGELAGDVSSDPALFDVVARRWGGSATALAGHAQLLVFAQGAAMNEKVHRAARAALELHEARAGWGVSISIMHSESGGDAMAITARAAAAQQSPTARAGTGGVLIAPEASAFLGPAFSMEGDERERVLTGFVASKDDARPVLGRSAACVGRDKELRLIESTLDECVSESSHRSVLLVAPPGVGKSRIRREFIERTRGRQDARILVARADVGTQSVTLGTLAAWIEDAHGPFDRESGARWQQLVRAVSELFSASGHSAAEAQSAAEFLGEIAGISAPKPSDTLLDARSNPRDMRMRLQSALESWLVALCAQTPTVLVLEDLHFVDASSSSLLSSAWSALEDAPLLLLMTSWPEGESLHPALWSIKNGQVIKLDPLAKRASERLARQLLGDEAPATIVQRVCELAAGNVFLLEEIVRHVGAGRSLDQLPTSAVAVVQSRLQSLPSDARKVLRAASVLGERFDAAALSALKTADSGTDDHLAILERLRREELVLSPADDRNARGEWSFRHSLVRQAAYEMLTESDRASAHRAAAQWLSSRSDTDPALVAAHFESAGARIEAAPWLLRAINEREEIGDYEAVSKLARRADHPMTPSDSRAEAMFMYFYAELFLGRHAVLAEMNDRLAQGGFARGSVGWSALTAALIAMKVHAGIEFDVRSEVRALLDGGARFAPSLSAVFTLSLLCVSLLHIGMHDEAMTIARELQQLTDAPQTPVGWIALRESYVPWVLAVDDDPSALARHRTAVNLAKAHCNTMRQLEIIPPYVTFAVEFGQEAEARSIAATFVAPPGQAHPAGDFGLMGEAAIHALGAHPRDCRELLARQQNPEWKHVDLWLRAYCLASPSLAAPTDVVAAREAVSALEHVLSDCGTMLTHKCSALALIAECALNAGDPSRAIAASDEVFATGDLLMPLSRTRHLLTRVVALRALGRDADAAREAGLAQSRITMLANGLEAGDRASFLATSAVARTMAL